MPHYDPSFYEAIAADSLESARVVVPMVVEMVRPQSVVDVGCGSGSWLQVFAENGVAEVLGLDGEWVDEEQLRFQKDRFRRVDLVLPFTLERQFDLAVCLEVAEHLPETSASSLIASLTKLASVVLFSAAIPGQRGTNHLNEQWLEYWIEKFRTCGYLAVDPFRSRIWTSTRVAVHYRQNVVLFLNPDSPSGSRILRDTTDGKALQVHSTVHPQVYAVQLDPKNLSTSDVVSIWLPQFARNKWDGLLRRLGIRGK